MIIETKKQPLPLANEEFDLFAKLLAEESGLYFDKDRNYSLQRALWERLQKRGHTSYQQYYHFLKSHAQGRQELHELFDMITIGETYFFRNEHQFDVLINSVLPEIIRKKSKTSQRNLRFWSAGCSRGDEVYSLAIAVSECLISAEGWNVSILGTDINRSVLDQAQKAVYGKRDVAHMPHKYIEKYFEVKNNTYILKDDVKRWVRFESNNLAKGAFALEGMRDVDVIFCRNVIIYFDHAVAKRLVENFYDCLVPDGYLFMGHAETLWHITTKFHVVEYPQAFVYRKGTFVPGQEILRPFVGVPEIKLEDFAEPGQAPAQPPAAKSKGLSSTPSVMPHEEEEALYQQASSFFAEKKYEEALRLFDCILSRKPGDVRACFAKATLLANESRYAEAIAELTKIIAANNLYVEAYYLLGVLFYKTTDLKGAEKQFRKVIYVDPEIVLAYYNLGNIYFAQEKYSLATREFKNAIRLLEKRPADEVLRFSEDYSVDSLRRVCQNNIDEIGEKN